MTDYAVIWPEGQKPLYLSRIKENDNGFLTSGYIINGAWNYSVRIDRNRLECKDWENKIIEKFPIPTWYDVVKFTSQQITHLGFRWEDYNDIIEWANTQPKTRVYLQQEGESNE